MITHESSWPACCWLLPLHFGEERDLGRLGSAEIAGICNLACGEVASFAVTEWATG